MIGRRSWLATMLFVASCSRSGPGGDAPDAAPGALTECGNHQVDPGEECDDGNTDNNDSCLDSCVAATCGDGHVNYDARERCDDGPDNTDSDPYACQTDCTICQCNVSIGQACMYDAGHNVVCGPCPDHFLTLSDQGGACYPELDDLQVSPGSLDSPFDPADFRYTVTVDPSVTEIQVVPTGWSMFGIDVFPDAATSPYGLVIGSNPFGISVTYNGTTGGYLVLVQRGLSITRLEASSPQPADEFGALVAADGDTVAVGATSEDAAGVDSGAVHVFRDGVAGWAEEALVEGSDVAAGDHFGYQLQLSGDNLVADGGGGVYVFHRTGTLWNEEAHITDPCSAHSLGGDTLTCMGPDGATVLRRDAGGTWGVEALLVGWSTLPGYDLITAHVSGDLLAADAIKSQSVGDEQIVSYAVFIYHRSGTTWSEEQAIETPFGADDGFAQVRALEGDRLVGTTTRRIYVYRRTGTGWASEGTIGLPWGTEESPIPVVVSVSGDRIAAKYYAYGLRTDGIHIFRYSGSSWQRETYIQATDRPESALESPALSGTALAAGARKESGEAGAAYVFDLPP